MSETRDLDAPQLTLGWRLRMAMEKAGIENNEMAQLLGVHRGTITRYTHDESVPKRGFIAQWAAICHVPAAWLAGELFSDPTDEDRAVPQPRRRASDITSDTTEDLGRYAQPVLARQERCASDLLLASR